MENKQKLMTKSQDRTFHAYDEDERAWYIHKVRPGESDVCLCCGRVFKKGEYNLINCDCPLMGLEPYCLDGDCVRLVTLKELFGAWKREEQS